jgi:hypothetical protein
LQEIQVFINFLFARIERPEHTAGGGVGVVILLADFGEGEKKSFVWGYGDWHKPRLYTSCSGEKAEFLAELHRLRSSSRPELVENTAGMGLHCALAHKKLFGDFAVAQALGD